MRSEARFCFEIASEVAALLESEEKKITRSPTTMEEGSESRLSSLFFSLVEPR